MKMYQNQGPDPRINEAIKFQKESSDYDSENRSAGLEDVKFSYGDQWPVEITNSRNVEARPCLTINIVDSYVRQVTNQQRQQRPRIKVQPCNNEADFKKAQIIQGLIRHIENNSHADTAYDTAVEYAVRCGWGYWRIITDYISDDSFDQEIYIEPIDDPFSVYFDPNSTKPDGSDAERCLITTIMTKRAFKKKYPWANDGAQFQGRGVGDQSSDWVTQENIRIAEYFYTEHEKATLLLLSNKQSIFKDELPDEDFLERNGIEIIDERISYRKKIKWCKLTALDILEEKEWPGKFIPIVPCYGNRLVVNGKRKKYGLVRNAKDSQRMYNYWRTSMTESIALAPRAKWVIAAGQDEGFEAEWTGANIKAFPVIHYNQTDLEGRPAPQPMRLQPEAPPAGIMQATAEVANDLQTVIGIVDPAMKISGNVSGKALQAQQMQIDTSNFHIYDNLTRSLQQTGIIILDLIPKIYDTERVMRIIGEDSKPELITINQKVALGQVLNDVTVGLYDVVMEIGPGYNSKRQEAVQAMAPLMNNPEIFKMAGDIFFRNMDFPEADILADRFAATNPLAQITDKKSDIPAQVQMQLAMSQQQIKDLQQKLMQAGMDIKYDMSVKQMQEDAETKRELIRATAKAHNTETIAEVKVNDQNTRSITSQNKSEIDALVKLLLARMSPNELIQEVNRMNAEQYHFASVADANIYKDASPYTELSNYMGQQTDANMQNQMP